MSTLTNLIEPQFITPEGTELLTSHVPLQDAIRRFLAAESRPETDLRPGHLIGRGRFSFAWRIGNVLAKVSSPTSSWDAVHSGLELMAEPLDNQFTFLRALGRHLGRHDPSIVVPHQYFVLYSPRLSAWLLCQEFMAGWVSLSRWAQQNLNPYGMFEQTPEEEAAVHQRMADYDNRLKARIRQAVAGSPLRHGLTDLRLVDKPNQSNQLIHGGNILIPETARPDDDPPICIIDQPGGGRAFRQALKLAVKST